MAPRAKPQRRYRTDDRPAGSGIYRYAEIDIQPPAGFEAPPPRVEEPVPQPALTAAAMTAAAMMAEEEL
jgi:hypothetical protein